MKEKLLVLTTNGDRILLTVSYGRKFAMSCSGRIHQGLEDGMFFLVSSGLAVDFHVDNVNLNSNFDTKQIIVSL